MRAFHDARILFGHNLSKSVFGTIILFVALSIITLAGSGTQAFGKFEWWFLNILAAWVVFAFVVFIFVLRTPKVLEDEAVTQARESMGELQAHNVKLQTELDAYTKQIEVLSRENQRQLFSDPNRNAIRHQVEHYIVQCKELEKRIESGDTTAGTRVNQLKLQISDYLKENYSVYRSDFFHPPVARTCVHQIKHDTQEALVCCRAMIEELKKVKEIVG